MQKLGFTEHQVGRMTFGKWSKLYQAYRDDFDIETTMRAKQIRYSDLEKEETLDDVMPF